MGGVLQHPRTDRGWRLRLPDSERARIDALAREDLAAEIESAVVDAYAARSGFEFTYAACVAARIARRLRDVPHLTECEAEALDAVRVAFGNSDSP